MGKGKARGSDMRIMRPRALVAAPALAALILVLPPVSCGGGAAVNKGTAGSAPIAVAGVAVSPKAVSVAVGATRGLTAAVVPPDATDATVTWRSGDAAKVAVGADGVVTGVAMGFATVTATTNDGGRTATCEVTVTPAHVAVTGITLIPAYGLVLGGSPAYETVFAEITPHDATDKTLAWSSDRPDIVAIVRGGGDGALVFVEVAAATLGTAVITAATLDGSVKATTTVSVTEEPEVLGREWDLAPNADVYVVGGCNRLFRNGVTTRLSQDPPFRFAHALSVSGADVHVAGEAPPPRGDKGAYALYWKDGEAQALGSGDTWSVVYDMSVSGGDVYLAGHWDDYPALWVNGEREMLGTTPYSEGRRAGGLAWTVFVSGEDVYVGGEVYVYGAIWKNGVREEVRPPISHDQSCVKSIFVYDGDVYAAVIAWSKFFGYSAWLYKNGEFTHLGGPSPDTLPFNVVVSDGDVYVLGCEAEIPVLWKNGVKQRLTDGSRLARAYGLAVSGGDVYAAGYQVPSPAYGPSIPTLWINGEAVDLRFSGFTNKAWAVSVTEKEGRGPKPAGKGGPAPKGIKGASPKASGKAG
jgi:hypothetical protein